MTQTLNLALLNFPVPFDREIDASGTTIGVGIVQRSHPITFSSQPFCNKLQWS